MKEVELNEKSIKNDLQDNNQVLDQSVNRSMNSAIVRKYEELRQSINIRNSQNFYKSNKNNTQALKGFEEPIDIPNHVNSLVNFDGYSQNTEYDMHQQITVQEKKPAVSTTDKNERSKEELAAKVDHKISLSELKNKYKTDFQNGLQEDQVGEHLALYGENKLTEKQKTPAWVVILKELTNGFAIMLWVSAGLCFLAYGLTPDDPSNMYLAIVLLIVIFITAFITYQQNAKSEALLNSFKSFIPQKSTVLRDGKVKNIESIKLVVGDIVLIKAGEKIPADIRILESSEMKVDNSALTGESEPQLRTVDCSHPENYLETSNIAFFGTLCKEGTAKGIVICTGDRTTLGQIADLSSGEKKSKTPLRTELDRFVYMVTILGIFLCILFFLLAYLVIGFPIMSCIVFGIGILVANVPEGLLGCITICLAITAKNLAKKQVLVKNLEAVETLGSTSCICTDKTGTLTQNVMTVKHIWINDTVFETPYLLHLQKGQQPPYDTNDIGFKTLQQAAMISSEAVFDLSSLQDQTNVDYLKCPVIGDATETGLIRFYQQIDDVNKFRSQFKIVKNSDDTQSRMPFSSQHKFALTVVEEESENSYYAVYMKGAPEKIWSYCSTVYSNNQLNEIDNQWQQKFKQVNLQFGKGGERVLGFAKLVLPATQFPKGTQFHVQNPSKFTFQLARFQFCGLVSLMDPPKPRVPYAILECRSAGIKVIMVTGDQPPTAAAIAKEVNIVPHEIITNEDLMENDQTLDWFTASEQCEAIIVHGDRILESFEKSIEEKRESPDFYLRQWVNKPYCVFARTTPAQKLQIVEACQKEGFIVAATGDGVNDSPAIKKADIGVSMNLSGSDVTKDAADMILLDDDFASIVLGVEEGRKIFDNLKKSCVYLLTSNMTEIVPFLAFIILLLPVPLSSIYMLVLQVGTDIWPAISLAYEEAELDVMTRKPRKKTDHLCSLKLVTIGYFQMGQLESAAGFVGYYMMFNYFGFPVRELFGLANVSGYTPLKDDFDVHKNPFTGNQQDPYFNSEILRVAGTYDCRLGKKAASSIKSDINWQKLTDGNFDLRKSLLKCNEQTGEWLPTVNWSDCDVKSSKTWSDVTSQTACYSTEALKWAQTGFFSSVVTSQWSNVFACKSRKMSFVTSSVNSVMFQGIIFETALLCFLLYVPGVQVVFGSRPYEFWMFCHGLFFSISLLLWDEVRKFTTRRFKWFFKFAYW
ncbi:Na,H/K antiporter P-type ATPase alpha subunit family protein (macronuclear) [Tetrahymena thermophila SB210]|uniref:Na,H/K antiporter P-type ATPase alpha subunit family protein n=1 Tax=Tetrahymena thermophila (strain SB210) TaxID=312017 RepID=I7ME52_TETTS|nr:Na,H/K antiporter P-type ATPase alpha subunit family protein [Tetrahymena thermophila SB210]EAR94958.2 Na,H/K antiporter P-type ATPase alpha subunit family protein [Tetrahymena thermophila SB210]|eukprot:XP_001015203.2 Na,H/K antiporter P-type ATPase alpha subunit family protein [Tetrahymena thermophila SB210]